MYISSSDDTVSCLRIIEEKQHEQIKSPPAQVVLLITFKFAPAHTCAHTRARSHTCAHTSMAVTWLFCHWTRATTRGKQILRHRDLLYLSTVAVVGQGKPVAPSVRDDPSSCPTLVEGTGPNFVFSLPFRVDVCTFCVSVFVNFASRPNLSHHGLGKPILVVAVSSIHTFGLHFHFQSVHGETGYTWILCVICFENTFLALKEKFPVKFWEQNKIQFIDNDGAETIIL